MKLPILSEIESSREMIDVFGGYNHNLRISNGEFYNMKNLSSSDYPVLSPRKRRGIYATPEKPQGLLAKDSLCYVDGENFIINGKTIPLGLTDGDKTLISMGAYVIIMPDKKYINTTDTSDCGPIESKVTSTGTVTFSLCRIDGDTYENYTISSSAPRSPENLALWLDTSSVPHTLKQYSTTNAVWTAIATTYIKISATGIGKSFSENDGVSISGCVGDAVADLNSTAIIWARGDDYIVVTGVLDKVTTQTAPITIARQMPNMDFVIESGNRLWGCRYGASVGGVTVNEIYASKLGDFKNWNSFLGISTDSYAATVGTDGEFTGAVTHLGYPIFFKENCMHKVYGNYPSNYQIQTTTCRGVQKGCERSLATVNEVLYYKARSGVCIYDGSLPTEISSAFGEEAYGNAVAGSLGNKYYISMQDTEKLWHLFVYDAKRGMWHREDDTQATAFCSCNGDLFFIDYADKLIKSVNGAGVAEGDVHWMAETGIIGTDSPDKKYVARIDVRLSITVGTRVHFYVQYDSDGGWEHLFTMTGVSLRSFAVPIRPQRCDHLRLRIEGNGEAKIYSICKTIEQGSDM